MLVWVPSMSWKDLFWLCCDADKRKTQGKRKRLIEACKLRTNKKAVDLSVGRAISDWWMYELFIDRWYWELNKKIRKRSSEWDYRCLQATFQPTQISYISFTWSICLNNTNLLQVASSTSSWFLSLRALGSWWSELRRWCMTYLERSVLIWSFPFD